MHFDRQRLSLSHEAFDALQVGLTNLPDQQSSAAYLHKINYRHLLSMSTRHGLKYTFVDLAGERRRCNVGAWAGTVAV